MHRLAQFAAVVLGFVLPLSTQAQDQTIRVGVQNFGFADGVAAPGTNFFVDLMLAIDEKTELELQLEPVTIADAIPWLLSDRIDVAATNLTITEERRAMGVELASPVVAWNEGLVVPDTDTTQYRSLEEFRGKPVGTTAGATPYEDPIKNAGAVLKSYSGGTDEGIAAMLRGEIVAYVVNEQSFLYSKEVEGEYQGVRLVESYIPVVNSAGGLTVKKGDTELLDQLKAAVAQLRADGTLERLVAEYRYSMPSG